MKPKLTRWFSGKHKPGRKGIYQRNYDLGVDCTHYCYWNGNVWSRGGTDPDYVRFRSTGYHKDYTPSPNQMLRWRGLRENPRKKK